MGIMIVVISSSTVSLACKKGWHWQLVLSRLKEMQEGSVLFDGARVWGNSHPQIM